MKITATKLRQNIYKVLDQILETGVPVEIERKGEILKIISEKKVDILDNLVEREDVINGDPEDIVHIDWSEEWKEKEHI
ncbi:MAG: type II toxin-antitoxin system Phd/YefM family antitoxin [Thermodesulfobacteriota bacterium]